MRVLLALFCIGIFPVIVFLTALLHGGITPSIIKTGLSNSGIYRSLPELISDGLRSEDNEFEVGETPSDSSQVFSLIADRLDDKYLKSKTEKLIDDTDLWLRGKTDVLPVLSFSEIKNDVMTSNPELADMIVEGMSSLKEQTSPETIDPMKAFIKNDFTFPLGQNLKGLKDAYSFLSIMLPAFGVLAVLSLVGIFLLSKTTRSKLKWLGITFFIASLVGFLWSLSGSILLAIITEVLKAQENPIAMALSPIGTHIASQFIATYKNYQMNSSYALLIIGAGLFATSFFVNKTASSPSKSPIKKKSTK